MIKETALERSNKIKAHEHSLFKNNFLRSKRNSILSKMSNSNSWFDHEIA